MSAKRHLLLGILALQNNFIDRPQLLAAFNLWADDKSKSLGGLLVEQHALTPEEHALLEALTEKHLLRHDQDSDKSLAALNSSAAAHDELAKVADPELHASLALLTPAGLHAAAGEDSDPDATLASCGQSVGNGRFRILRPHASGGLGEVSVALDQELNRQVAFKEIKARHAHNPETRARFLLEAEITGSLEHPGIVPVYSLGTYADGRPFYAMRLIKGDSLKEAIRNFHNPKPRDESSSPAGPSLDFHSLDFRKLLGRLIDVCNAVAYAHSRGVLHRDLKPGNIMLGKYGETLVVDWGLAKAGVRGQESRVRDEGATDLESLLQPGTGSSGSETLPGSALGTPSYMSPEQAAGQLDELGPASDVYSLGATLYQLLTGQPPVEGRDVAALLKQVQTGDFPTPRRRQPAVPPALEAVCLKAMALKPEQRYPTPRALADDLEHWLGDEPVAAHREPASARASRWARKHKTLVTGAAGLLVAAVIALSVGTLMIGSEQARTENARAEAVTNFENAEAARKNADAERRRAEKLADESQERLVRSFVNNGLRLMDQGNLRDALVWLTEALKRDKGHPEREEIHRTRIASLLQRCSGLSRILSHDGRVNHACFSADGTRVATASHDRTAQIWDVASGQPLTKQPLEHPDKVTYAAFSEDGSRLLTVCADRAVRVWDVITGKAVSPPLANAYPVSLAAISPNGQRVATSVNLPFDKEKEVPNQVWVTGEVTVRDAVTGKPVGPAIQLNFNPAFLVFSPDSMQLAVANASQAVVFEATTAKAVSAETKFAGRLAFSPDGQHLAAMDAFGNLKILKISDGKELCSASSPGTTRLQFSADGKRLFTLGAGLVVAWDAKTGVSRGFRDVRGLESNDPWVVNEARVAKFSRNGGNPLNAGNAQFGGIGGNAFNGGMMGMGGMMIPLPLVDEPQVARFSLANGERYRVVLGELDSAARLLDDVLHREAPVQLRLNFVPAHGARFTSDWRYLVTFQPPLVNEVVLVDALSGRPTGIRFPHGEPIDSVVISPDDRRILTISGIEQAARLRDGDTDREDRRFVTTSVINQPEKPPPPEVSGKAIIWDRVTGKRVGQPILDISQVPVFSPDGRRLATLSTDNAVHVWDASTGEPIAPPLRHSHPPLVRFSRDGTRLLTATPDEARVWDTGTSKPIGAPLRLGSSSGVSALSPDGQTGAVVADDRSVQVWDVATGDLRFPVLQHPARVIGLELSPNGKLLAAVSEDGAVQLWDFTTGRRAGPVFRPSRAHGFGSGGGDRSPRIVVQFSADGHRLMTTTETADLQVWDVHSGEPVTASLSPLTVGVGGSLIQAYFSADGRRILAYVDTSDEFKSTSHAQIWEIAPDPRPAEDLVLLARIISGHRVDADGLFQPCEPAVTRAAWQSLRTRAPADFAATENSLHAWHWRQAAIAEAINEPQAALAHLDALVEAEPLKGRLLLRHGHVNVALQRWDQAVEDFTGAVAHGVKDEEIHWARARANARAGKWQKSLADYDKILEQQPEHAPVLLARHVARAALGRWEEASKDFSTAMQLFKKPDPDNGWNSQRSFSSPESDQLVEDLSASIASGAADWWVWRARGLISVVPGGPGMPAGDRQPEAAKDLAQAIALKADDWESHRLLACAHAGLKQWQPAIAACDKGIALKGDDWGLWFVRGIAQQRLRQNDKAVADLSRALKLRPDSWGVLAERAFAFLQQENYDAAITDFSELMKKTPNDTELLSFRGQCYYRKKQVAMALADFDRALKLKENFTEALRQRSHLFRERGDLAKAIADLRALISVDFANHPNYYIESGHIRRQQKDFLKAIANYSVALQQQPRNETARFQRASTYADLKKYDLAIADFTAARPLASDDLIGRGIAYQNRGEQDNALLDFAAAQEQLNVGNFFLSHESLLPLLAATKLADREEKAIRRVIGACEAHLAVNTDDLAVRWVLASYHDLLGQILMVTGRLDTAEKSFRQALALCEKNLLQATDSGKSVTARIEVDIDAPLQVARFVSKDTVRLEVAVVQHRLGQLLAKRGRTGEAVKAHREALALREQVAATDAKSAAYRQLVTDSLGHLAGALQSAGQIGEAEKTLRRVVDVWTALAKEFPESPDFRHSLTNIEEQLGFLLYLAGRDADAERLQRQALAAREKLSAAYPQAPTYRAAVPLAHLQLGRVLAHPVQAKDKLAAVRAALKHQEKLVIDFPQEVAYRQTEAMIHLFLEPLLLQAGEAKEARQAGQRGAALLEELAKKHPAHAGCQHDLAWFLVVVPPTERHDAVRAVTAARRAVTLAPQNADYWHTLGVAYYRVEDWKATVDAMEKAVQCRGEGLSEDAFFLAMAHWRLGSKDEARRRHDQAVSWMRTRSADDELRRLQAESATTLGLNDVPKQQ